MRQTWKPTRCHNCAARMAKLKTYQLKEWPVTESFFDKLLLPKDTDKNIKIEVLQLTIGEENAAILKQIQTVKIWFGTTQARLPFFVSFN